MLLNLFSLPGVTPAGATSSSYTIAWAGDPAPVEEEPDSAAMCTTLASLSPFVVGAAGVVAAAVMERVSAAGIALAVPELV
ncbi:Hypothetical protein PHPALM_17089, partial [Phytophthora palmivora]